MLEFIKLVMNNLNIIILGLCETCSANTGDCEELGTGLKLLLVLVAVFSI